MIKIRDLLKEGESETVEFKPSLSQKDKITESISAFSNTKGGTVVIGVSDKGEVLGVDIGKNTIESLANQIKQNTDPMAYAKDLQRRFIQSEVKCIRFKGVGVTGEMIDLRTVGGDVFEQLIEAEKFWNPGRLPEGWNVQTLKEAHESIPRNPSIAKQFFWVKYIEEVGTGTNKIIKCCIDWGLPEPEFELEETSFVVTFIKSKLTDEYLEHLGLNERQKKAIKYLKEHGKIDRKTYSTICGVEKTLAHEELADMVNKELLDVAGTGKGIHYILRTKRTNSGRIEKNNV